MIFIYIDVLMFEENEKQHKNTTVGTIPKSIIKIDTTST